ncbi:MAG: hypothetical protein R2705_21025 [Ilumatobacteraceae bacterium]
MTGTVTPAARFSPGPDTLRLEVFGGPARSYGIAVKCPAAVLPAAVRLMTTDVASGGTYAVRSTVVYDSLPGIAGRES